MFDEGEKELTIFILRPGGSNEGKEVGQGRVGCSRKGMSGVSRSRQCSKRGKEKEKG